VSQRLNLLYQLGQRGLRHDFCGPVFLERKGLPRDLIWIVRVRALRFVNKLIALTNIRLRTRNDAIDILTFGRSLDEGR
jgi:hypothetical protein